MEQRKRLYRKILYVLLGVTIILTFIMTIETLRATLPDHIRLTVKETGSLTIPFHGDLALSDDARAVSVSRSPQPMRGRSLIMPKTSFDLRGLQAGNLSLRCRLWGLIPVKSIEVSVTDALHAYPSGAAVGLYLESDGLLVIGIGSVDTQNNRPAQPALGKLRAGDYLLQIDDRPLAKKEDLRSYLSENSRKSCTLLFRRGREVMSCEISPATDQFGEQRLGIWIRDDVQGIGTITCVQPNGHFSALGHAVHDSDTGDLLESVQGTLYPVVIRGIQKASERMPGTIAGAISYEEKGILGYIDKNTEAGLCGRLSGSAAEWQRAGLAGEELLPIAGKYEVKTGPALIRSDISGKIETYAIEILQTDPLRNGAKGITLRVTDSALLALTGGIVQGMSGSPIIQNGKLIGAITHVLIDDSTKGYGIFIEEMLSE